MRLYDVIYARLFGERLHSTNYLVDSQTVENPDLSRRDNPSGIFNFNITVERLT